MQAQSQENRTVRFLSSFKNIDFPPLTSIYRADFHYYEVTVLFPPLRIIKSRKSFWKGGHPKQCKISQLPPGWYSRGIYQIIRDTKAVFSKWMNNAFAEISTTYRSPKKPHCCLYEYACFWERATKY